jgi:hypothetical protein
LIEQEIHELLKILDGLPLALAQAASHMRETGMCSSTYVRLYKEQWPELMGECSNLYTLLPNYLDGSIATTWRTSYTAVQTSSEVAANLLLLWAHLDNGRLWYGLLAAASRKSSAAAKYMSAWLGNVARNELDFLHTIRVLRRHSLVQELDGQTGYTIHPVLHRWLYSIQSETQRKALLHLALMVSDRGMPDGGMCTPLQPHVGFCVLGMKANEGRLLDEGKADELVGIEQVM